MLSLMISALALLAALVIVALTAPISSSVSYVLIVLLNSLIGLSKTAMISFMSASKSFLKSLTLSFFFVSTIDLSFLRSFLHSLHVLYMSSSVILSLLIEPASETILVASFKTSALFLSSRPAIPNLTSKSVFISPPFDKYIIYYVVSKVNSLLKENKLA